MKTVVDDARRASLEVPCMVHTCPSKSGQNRHSQHPCRSSSGRCTAQNQCQVHPSTRDQADSDNQLSLLRKQRVQAGVVENNRVAECKLEKQV